MCIAAATNIAPGGSSFRHDSRSTTDIPRQSPVYKKGTLVRGQTATIPFFFPRSPPHVLPLQNCGISSFQDGGGGKVGEAIYIGTGLDNLDDGKVSKPSFMFVVNACVKVRGA